MLYSGVVLCRPSCQLILPRDGDPAGMEVTKMTRKHGHYQAKVCLATIAKSQYRQAADECCSRLVPAIYPKIGLQYGLPYLPGYWETVYAGLSPIISRLQCSNPSTRHVLLPWICSPCVLALETAAGMWDGRRENTTPGQPGDACDAN